MGVGSSLGAIDGTLAGSTSAKPDVDIGLRPRRRPIGGASLGPRGRPIESAGSGSEREYAEGVYSEPDSVKPLGVTKPWDGLRQQKKTIVKMG